MVSSQNTKVTLTIEGTSFLGMTSYGKVMIGDRAFEFYNDKNVRDFIQIPWSEIDFVSALVLFKGKIIPRFMIQTKGKAKYCFSTRDNKKTLREMRTYLGADKLLRSLSFLDVVKLGCTFLIKRLTFGSRR